VPNGGVHGGYSVMVPTGRGDGEQGGSLDFDFGICMSSHHCVLGKFGFYWMGDGIQAFNGFALYRFKHSVAGRLLLSYGVGIGGGGHDGCYGCLCGRCGVAWHADVVIGLRVLRWMEIELINDLTFQGGMSNGVDVLVMYSPLLGIRFGREFFSP
jgi:hypothetical protein